MKKTKLDTNQGMPAKLKALVNRMTNTNPVKEYLNKKERGNS
tara:strand:- start:421 stop:546 length:126 start_codon:yes stop_codon:yes gene_type:complete